MEQLLTVFLEDVAIRILCKGVRSVNNIDLDLESSKIINSCMFAS
jgi:hypothetical protein